MSLINDALSNTAFSHSSDDSELKGQTTEPPYIQFEKCKHAKEFNCKYKDVNGNCTKETCVMDNNEVPKVNLQTMQCMICGETYMRRPEEERVPFCDSCIQRMHELEKLPHKCVFCGKTIEEHQPLIFGGICSECLNTLRTVMKIYRQKKDWTWCRH